MTADVFNRQHAAAVEGGDARALALRYEDLVKSLQQQYEESEATVEQTKNGVKPRLKMLRAATTAATPAATKDEV